MIDFVSLCYVSKNCNINEIKIIPDLYKDYDDQCRFMILILYKM